MIARGKHRAQRDASPLDHNNDDYEALKERNNYQRYLALSVLAAIDVRNQGRRASLRSALAPSFHISRRWRCSRFRAFGATAYFAPLALQHISAPLALKSTSGVGGKQSGKEKRAAVFAVRRANYTHRRKGVFNVGNYRGSASRVAMFGIGQTSLPQDPKCGALNDSMC
jgi:hypothetical protein